jgi:hypothetical protein
MKNGTYNQRINWEKFKVKKFPIHLFDVIENSLMGCGANALATILGDNPESFKTKDNHYPDSFMLKHLRKNGIKCFEITKSNLTNTKKAVLKLDDRNVILSSHLMAKGDATWLINFGNNTIHNQEITKCNYWQLINFPIISAYCLIHPSWLK